MVCDSALSSENCCVTQGVIVVHGRTRTKKKSQHRDGHRPRAAHSGRDQRSARLPCTLPAPAASDTRL